MALNNNVLFYINQYLSNDNPYGLYHGCKLLFTEKQIEDSKRLLLETCSRQLTEISPATKDRVKDVRKGSYNRSKVDMEINDIISIISAFSIAEKPLGISKNEDEYTPNMAINPELLNPFTILEKLREGDKQINALVKANGELMKLYEELMQKHNILQTEFTEINKNKLNLTTTCMCPSVEEPPAVDPIAANPAPSPNTPQPAPAPLDPVPSPGEDPPPPPTETFSAPLLRSRSEPDLSKIPTTHGTLTPTSKIPSPADNNKSGNRAPQRHKSIPGKVRHQMNLAITEAALDASNEARDQGKDTVTAKMVGKVAATAVAKTYASAALVNRPTAKHSPMQVPTRQHTQSPPARIGYVPAKPSSYKRGNASPMNTTSIAFKHIRPAHLDNKCLAVSRIDRSISKTQCREYINAIAKKEINILFLKDITRKDFKKWRTIVLELSPEDYTLLSDENLWDPSIGIREFSGYKYWRNEKKTNTQISPTNQPNTSVGESWT